MQILEYKSAQPAPHALTLEDSDGTVELTFPLLSKWVRLGAMVFTVTCLVVGATLMCMMAWKLWQISRQAGLPFSAQRNSFVYLAEECLFVVAVAVYLFAHELKWGHIPNTLTLTGGKLVSTRGWVWGMRKRTFNAADIVSVEITPVPDIFHCGRTFTLIFQFRSRRLFTTRITTRDPDLPERVLAAFRRELKLPKDGDVTASPPTAASRAPEARSSDTPAA